jgi:excisionase family DNA binding protein
MDKIEDPILTTTAAARLLGVATSTVQVWMETRTIPSWKTPGGHRRTRLSNINDFLQRIQAVPGASLSQVTEVTQPPGLSSEFQPAPLPRYPVDAVEPRRLMALAASGLIDTPPEDRFDRIVRLASLVTGSPIALVSLLTSSRQWFKARIGLEAQETPREWAFCSHALLNDKPFVVEDAATDPRFFGNPLVQGEPRIRFYAGVPIRDKAGLALGTLCVIDREPRKLRATELQAMLDLAAMASQEAQANPAPGKESTGSTERIDNFALPAQGNSEKCV